MLTLLQCNFILQALRIRITFINIMILGSHFGANSPTKSKYQCHCHCYRHCHCCCHCHCHHHCRSNFNNITLTGKTYSDRTRQRMDGGLSKVEPSLKERIFASCRLSSSKPLSPTIRNIVVIFCKNNIVRIQIKTSIHLL